MNYYRKIPFYLTFNLIFKIAGDLTTIYLHVSTTDKQTVDLKMIQWLLTSDLKNIPMTMSAFNSIRTLRDVTNNHAIYNSFTLILREQDSCILK